MEADARRSVQKVIRDCLRAIERQDWAELAGYFHPDAIIFVAEGNEERAQAWNPEIGTVRELFSLPGGQPRPFRLPFSRLQFDVMGTSAFVWFDGSHRARERDIVLTQANGRWLIRHFNLRFLDAPGRGRPTR